MSSNFELDEELNNVQQDSVHIPREISIEGEHQKTLERILNGMFSDCKLARLQPQEMILMRVLLLPRGRGYAP